MLDGFSVERLRNLGDAQVGDLVVRDSQFQMIAQKFAGLAKNQENPDLIANQATEAFLRGVKRFLPPVGSQCLETYPVLSGLPNSRIRRHYTQLEII